MIRIRLGGLFAAVSLLGLIGATREAFAVAETHRLNIVASGIPTGIAAKDFNNFIDNINRTQLDPRGIEGIDKISFGWLFETEVRYFVRQDIAVTAGVGQLRSQSRREILPGLQQDVQLRAEILSVPVHIGGDYYFAPYNQGDFRARAFAGAGYYSLVYNRGRFQQVATGLDTSLHVPGQLEITGRGDSPGFYVETGAHLFFATRFSVLLGVIYRSARVENLQGRTYIDGRVFPFGRVFNLDTSGFGARMSLAIGL